MYSFLYENRTQSVKGFFMENKFLILSERSRHEILEFLPSSKDISQMADLFQSFSDTTRLKILTCLAISDMCVNDLAKILELKQTTVSHQLQLLRKENLVGFQRIGKIIIYSLQKKAINDIMLTAVQCL